MPPQSIAGIGSKSLTRVNLKKKNATYTDVTKASVSDALSSPETKTQPQECEVNKAFDSPLVGEDNEQN